MIKMRRSKTKKPDKNRKKAICGACIVKRERHVEDFDERKVYASCYAACLSAHIRHLEAELICDKVAKEVKIMVMKRKIIKSKELSMIVVKAIAKHDKNAAFMYETHKDIG